MSTKKETEKPEAPKKEKVVHPTEVGKPSVSKPMSVPKEPKQPAEKIGPQSHKGHVGGHR